MKKSIEKFLEFNGKTVTFLNVDGNWWVAIKPICDVLEVNYNRSFQNLKEDEILMQLFAEQQMVAADGRLRKMVCLPEKFIYGWLFSLRSESEGLVEFKLKCYEVLFEHFHGGITGKLKNTKLKNLAEIEYLNKEVAKKNNQDADFIRVKLLESENMRLGKEIVKAENELDTLQLDIFRQQFNGN